MGRCRSAGSADVLVRVAVAQLVRLAESEPGRDVANQRIVGRCLVGDHVGFEAAAQQLGQDLGGVSAESDAERAALGPGRLATGDRVVEIVGLLVEVAGLEPAADPLRIDLDAEGDPVVHGHRQRLGAAHAAEPRGQRDRPGERAAEAAAGDLGEALVGALDDPLAADVDPRARGHLPVHRQPELLEPAKLVPVRPLADQVRVRDQDPRRPLVGAKDADRLARLNQQRLVVGERAQFADDRVERVPGARRPPGAAVDDEVVGALGDLGIEVVHQHPHRGLLAPAAAAELGAVGGVNLARAAHSNPPTASSTAASRAPSASRRSAASSSGETQRSGPGPPTTPRSASSAAPVPAAGASGARSSIPRQAQVSSTASIRLRLATDSAQLARGPPAHRDVVLLHRRGRQRIDRRRGRQAAVLGRHRRLRVLGDHQARVDPRVGSQEGGQALGARRVEQAVGAPLADRADLGRGDREEVAGHRDRSTVEVAARLDPAVGQDHRVVDRRSQLGLGHPLGVGDGVAGGAVDLRAAADRVRVLDPRVVGAMAGDDRRAAEQPAQVGRARGLPGLRAQGDQVLGEGAVGSEQRLGARRGGDVGEAQKRAEIGEGEDQHPEDAVGAVDQRQALLRPEHRRLDPGSLERRRSGDGTFVGVEHLPLPEHRQRAVSERGQIAAGAERPVLGNHRIEPLGEHRDDRLGELRPRSRESHRQRSRPSRNIARTASRSIGGPMPAACERISARCSSVRRSAGIRVCASDPNPVETP